MNIFWLYFLLDEQGNIKSQKLAPFLKHDRPREAVVLATLRIIWKVISVCCLAQIICRWNRLVAVVVENVMLPVLALALSSTIIGLVTSYTLFRGFFLAITTLMDHEHSSGEN